MARPQPLNFEGIAAQTALELSESPVSPSQHALRPQFPARSSSLRKPLSRLPRISPRTGNEQSRRLKPPPKSPLPSTPADSITTSPASIPVLLGSPRHRQDRLSAHIEHRHESHGEDNDEYNFPDYHQDIHPAHPSPSSSSCPSMPSITPSVIIPTARPTLMARSASVRVARPTPTTRLSRSASVASRGASTRMPRPAILPRSASIASRPSHPIRTSSLPPLDGDEDGSTSPTMHSPQALSCPQGPVSTQILDPALGYVSPQRPASPTISATSGDIFIALDLDTSENEVDVRALLAALPDLERDTEQLNAELIEKEGDVEGVERDLWVLRREGEELLEKLEKWLERTPRQ